MTHIGHLLSFSVRLSYFSVGVCSSHCLSRRRLFLHHSNQSGILPVSITWTAFHCLSWLGIVYGWRLKLMRGFENACIREKHWIRSRLHFSHFESSQSCPIKHSFRRPRNQTGPGNRNRRNRFFKELKAEPEPPEPFLRPERKPIDTKTHKQPFHWIAHGSFRDGPGTVPALSCYFLRIVFVFPFSPKRKATNKQF